MKLSSACKLSGSLCCIGGFLWWYIAATFALHLPTHEGEIAFYCSELHDDLKYVVACALRTTNRSLFFSSFAFTDLDIASLLAELQENNRTLLVAIDPKERNFLPRLIPTTPYQGYGLMHRKIAVIDNALVLLGSTNITPSGFYLHHNQIVALYSPALAKAVLESAILVTQDLTYYPLPLGKDEALDDLLDCIHKAKHRIFLAQYTLTHPRIINALLEAQSKGISVRIYLDRSSAHGSSRKAATRLASCIATNTYTGLLHHKCALIDDTFIFGSTNWTKAGFGKNQEVLLFLFHLPKEPMQKIERFFDTLQKTCRPQT